MEARRRPYLPASALLLGLAGTGLALADGLGRCPAGILVPALWAHGLLGLVAGLVLGLLPGPWRRWRGVPGMPAAVALVVAGAASTLALRPPPEPPRAPADAPDLLLLTLDTTRADRWAATATPGRGLEAGAAVFTRTWATTGLTAPAHASLWTGRMPWATGVTNNGAVLPAALPVLPELLRAAGWHTMAAPSVLHLDPAFGFARGFVAVAPVEDGLAGRLRPFQAFHLARLLLRLLGPGRVVRPGGATLAAARSLWNAAPPDRPRFLWVHLFEPHWPYSPPPEDLAAAAVLPAWPEVPVPGFDPAAVAVWRRRYDGEILAVRRLATRLVAELEADATRRGRPLWVVLTGDHGEALGEHGAADHGDLLYEEQLRVPLLVRGPDVRPGRVAAPASHLDLLPSILDLLGLRRPPGLPGRSWVPALQGKELAERTVLAETRHAGADGAMALRDGVKLIRTLRLEPAVLGRKPGRSWVSPPQDGSLAWSRENEVYDLRQDPWELRPLPSIPARADPREALVSLLRRRGPPPARVPSPPPEVAAALAGLGYGGR